ncbi:MULTISPECIES: hypothetical protein [unclassified Rothia (in: high G+C Gram-positive bacteria)]|uniref:hypothetical protein n=1 Tax=Rothia TaxID=32207 RepID=UPI00143A1458|nr:MULTISPECIES: hypothetical protein [unclassified Rothia (in: high G+C Gram-positive bacteria)]
MTYLKSNAWYLGIFAVVVVCSPLAPAACLPICAVFILAFGIETAAHRARKRNRRV